MEITAVHAQCPILAEKILSLGGSTLLLSPAFGNNSANCPTLSWCHTNNILPGNLEGRDRLGSGERCVPHVEESTPFNLCR